MANRLYPQWKAALMNGAFNAAVTSGSVCAYLIDTEEYTFSASESFVAQITKTSAGTGSAIVAKSSNISGVTVASGVFDCSTVTWVGVTGDQAEAIIFAVDRPSAFKARIIAYLDTGQTGLPVTPNGGDITFTPSSVGVFEL